MAGEISLTCQIGRPRMSATGGSQVAYVLVEARAAGGAAAGAAAGSTRMPVNFTLVLDHSGSMKGAKLAAVKEAVKLVINRLGVSDMVSVVVFDDNVRVVVPAQPAADKPYLTSLIDGIKDGGGTAMSLGMSAGLNELRKHATPASVNRMILLTDGVTYGDADRCRRIADEAGAVGIGIYPLGIGADWDEDLLDNVGHRSGGMPAEVIRRPDDALGIFERQLESAEAVSVRNAQLTIRLPGGVTPKRSVRVLPLISPLGQETLSDREALASLGDIEYDTPQALLLELLVDPRPAGTFRIAQAELSYDAWHRESAGRRGGHLHHRDGAAGRGELRRAKLRREGERASSRHACARRIQEGRQGYDAAPSKCDTHAGSGDAAPAGSGVGGRRHFR